MNEQVPLQDIVEAHQAALDRDYRETLAARAIASSGLVQASIQSPDIEGAYLSNAQLIADSEAGSMAGRIVHSTSAEATRDQKVARGAGEAFRMQKQAQERAFGNVAGMTDANLSKAAAERAITDLRNQAARHLAEADNDEHRGRLAA